MENSNLKFVECCVIGCGISGIAVSRWLKEYQIDYMVFEKSNDLGGLWRFQRDGYGVMDFTHINVSKYNYHFSDFPFPKDQVEFMHHKHIYDYAKAYMEKFKLFENVKFNCDVTSVEEVKINDPIRNLVPKFEHVKATNKLWKLKVKTNIEGQNEEMIYVTPFVAVCTGHHGTPRMAKFEGQESFPGEIIHSVKYKSAKMNNFEGKRVLLVGIGNSSVDVADNLVTEGNCPEVTISTRSGCWIYPNYLNGYPSETYASRFLLMLPAKLQCMLFENIIKLVNGDPKKYNLNPKHRILESHPTISPTIHHHIQRGRVNIEPNIKKIEDNEVIFENCHRKKYDSIILCTGYRIMLDFLDSKIRSAIFEDKDDNYLKLFKMVFSPQFGYSLGFIGFVQPQTGGIISMSEIQARWFVYLMTGKIQLPSKKEMNKEIRDHRKTMNKNFYTSARHTMQENPLNYNDGIADYFGARPSWIRNPTLSWRFAFSSGGPAQWRLNGIDSMPDAAAMIREVPVPPITKFIVLALIILLLLSITIIVLHPRLLPLIVVPLLAYKIVENKDKWTNSRR